MPNDKIIQFNNKLYFGNQLSQLPDIAQLNDTLLYHSKKIVPVTNLDIQNVYTINMGVVPDGYNIYIGTISSYFSVIAYRLLVVHQVVYRLIAYRINCKDSHKHQVAHHQILIHHFN